MAEARKKRIGLLLASIHTGTAVNVWSSFARKAEAENMTLFIFPGGKLSVSADMEHLRNPVYSLANAKNLDGLISWSSTFGYTVPPEEFSAFHKTFDPLPYLTIANKVEGHPCVYFDAYRGMKQLVSHFIAEHGAKKIAFLRGPDTHDSAIDRFNGYRGALEEAGIPYDAVLVTSPFGWSNGEAACTQLLENRDLVPGRDFDTLIGSSDMMIFPAVQYLNRRGYELVRDYRAGGFNNSSESNILSKSLSTVRIPYEDLSGESFKILRNLLKTDGGAQPDVTLPCEVIIRESCGCFQRDRPKIDSADMDIFAVPLAFALMTEDEALYFELFKKIFARFLESGRDIDSFLGIIQYVFTVSADFVAPAVLSRFEMESYRIAARMQELSYSQVRYQQEKLNSALNSLKSELLGTRDRKSLVESLARHLPKIGIYTSAVMLSVDDRLTECIGSFSSEGICAGEGRQFPSEQLLPGELSGQYAKGVFMVQPLFIENRSLGYFLTNLPFYDGVILEELRSSISNALKGIFMFEETLRAKQIAEQAERAKTEFFAAIGNNLYDPFIEIIAAIAELEQGSGTSSPDKLMAHLASLKSTAVLRQTQTNRLIDLTLSQMDEVSFAKSLFPITGVLPELKAEGQFPLFSGDPARLSEAFSLIRPEYGGKVSAKLAWHGLELLFEKNPVISGRENKPVSHTLLLAERIILLHQGELRCDKGGCSVLLPWTTYTGQNASRKTGARNGSILALSEMAAAGELAVITGLPVITSLEKAMKNPGRITFIVWDSDTASAEELLRVSSLGSCVDFFQTPLLCYGSALSGETLCAAVNTRIKGSKKLSVLFIGIEGNALAALWELPGTLPVQADFADAVAIEAPGLIVLGSADMEMLQTIRSHPATVMTPVIVLPEHITSEEAVLQLCQYPRLVLCNRAVALSPEFARRVRAIASGDSILPVYTGALVKKAILYFNQRASSHISRWKLADAINVSEDYLTRIFRREMGFSLWEYLNNYRVHLAAELLTHTGETIYEVALKTGFQDQAYFCRVFKKIYGKAPGQLRKP